MAEEFIDIAGRVIKATEGLADTIREGMESAVKKVNEFGERDEIRNNTLEDIKSLMEQLRAINEEHKLATESLVNEVIQTHESKLKGHTATKGKPDDLSQMEKIKETIEKNLEVYKVKDQSPTEQASDSIEIDQHGKPWQVWVAGGFLNSKIIEMPETREERLVGDQMGSIPVTIEGAESTEEPTSKAMKSAEKGGGLNQTGQKTLLRQMQQMATGLLGIITAITGGLTVSNIFEGAIKEELDYHKLMSRIAKQTHGLSEATKTLQDDFRRAGNRLEIVAQTGQKIGHWMDAMVKAQMRGLKNQKFNNKMVKSALNMATMTGIEVESATEMYANWAQHFHMSNMELATMNWAIKDIARQTGLTGKNLEEALKIADSMQRKLRASGNATREMVESTMRIAAIAKKEGIEDVFGTYTDALMGGFGKFAELPNNIKGALMRFSQNDGQLMEDVMAGRGMQEENLRKLAEGMKVDTKSILGLDLMTADLTKIDSTRMKSLQIMAEKVYGMSIGDLQKMVQTMHEGSRTIAERAKEAEEAAHKDYAALEMQRKKGLITEEQFNKMLADRQKQLEQQQTDLKMTDISKTLNEVLGDAAKEGGVKFNEALIKAGGGDMAAGIEKVQSGFATAAQDVESKMKAALESGAINQQAFDTAMKGFDAGGMTKELETALAAGDTSKVASLQEKLVQMQQTADAQSMKNTNVVDRIENHIIQLNALFRDKLSDNLIDVLTSIGAVGVIITMVGATIATAIAGLGIILTTMLGRGFMGKLITGVGSAFGGVARKLFPMGMATKVAGMPIKGSVGPAARAAGLSKAGTLFKEAGQQFKSATVPFVESVSKFGVSTKDYIKNSRAFKAITNAADDFGRYVARMGVSIKDWVKGTRLFDKASKAQGFLSKGGQAVGRALQTGKKTVLGKVDDAGRAIARGGRAVAQSKVGGAVIKGVSGTGKAVKGLGKAGLTTARALGTTLKAVTSWTFVLPFAISAAEGLAGALQAGAKAHELFGVEADETTERMRIAAEGAGIFTGVLDGLTLGFFSKWLGPTGSITEALAKFLHTFWPLAGLLQVILVPFKVLWGVLKGLWLFLKESFIGLWEGIKVAMEPVNELFDILWGAMSEIGGALMGLVGAFGFATESGGKLPSIVGTISTAFQYLGKALGFVFMVIGYMVKGLTPLIKLFGFLVKLITGFVVSIIEAVKGMVEGVVGFFTWLYDILIGHSIIPDIIMGIFNWFLKLPGLIFKAIMSIPNMIVNTLAEIPKKFIEISANILDNLGLGGLADILRSIGEAFSNVVDIISGILTLDFTKVWEGVKGLSGALWESIKGIPGMIWDGLTTISTILVDTLSGIGTFMWDTITGALSGLADLIWEGLTTLPTRIINGLSKIGTFMWDTITGALSGLVDWVLSFIPGAKKVAEGFTESSKEQSETWAKEGASVAHGVGGAVGGVKEVLTGNIMEGGGKIVKGTGEAIVGVAKGAKNLAVNVADKVGGAVKAVASTLNPFNWFEAGTRKIEKTGLGVLHEGEAVIPAGIVDQIKAEGSGPFDKLDKTEGSNTKDIQRMINIASKPVEERKGKGIDSVVEIIKKSPIVKGITSIVNQAKETPVGQSVSKAFDTINPLKWLWNPTKGLGEVSAPNNATGETRTMTTEESAESRIARHKLDGQLQQVESHSDTSKLENIGLGQSTTLSEIRDDIRKLVAMFNTPDRPSEIIGAGGGVAIGDPSTRYTGNAAALDFGASPYSAANEPGFQQVVSQGGVGE